MTNKFDYGDKKENGQYERYPTDNSGSYVAELRYTYVHRNCGVATKVSSGIAETYAKNPKFYTATFCVGCGQHFPVSEFAWDDGTTVGEIGVYSQPNRLGRSARTTHWEQEEYEYVSPLQRDVHAERMKSWNWIMESNDNPLVVTYSRSYTLEK